MGHLQKESNKMTKPSLTVKWDNEPAMSRPSPKRGATPYVRGLVIAAAAGLEPLVNQRVIAWGDSDPIETFQGKFCTLQADLRDKVEVEVPGQTTVQETIVLANIKVTHVATEEESAELQGQAMLAQLGHLNSRGARKIVRTPEATAEAPAAAASTDPQGAAANVAAAALTGSESQTLTTDDVAKVTF